MNILHSLITHYIIKLEFPSKNWRNSLSLSPVTHKSKSWCLILDPFYSPLLILVKNSILHHFTVLSHVPTPPFPSPTFFSVAHFPFLTYPTPLSFACPFLIIPHGSGLGLHMAKDFIPFGRSISPPSARGLVWVNLIEF